MLCGEHITSSHLLDQIEGAAKRTVTLFTGGELVVSHSEGGMGGIDRGHQLGEFGRFHGEGAIRPAVGTGQGEVFLDEGRSKRSGGDGRGRSQSVIREPHLDTEALAQHGDGTQVVLGCRCRIAADTVQQGQLAVAMLERHLDRGGDLGLVRHAGGHDKRLAGLGGVADEGQVHQLEGGDLVGRTVEGFQQIHRAEVEWAAKDRQAQLAPFGKQRLVPLPRGVRPLIKVIEAVAIPQAAVDLKFRSITFEGDGIRTVGLQLDGAGTRCFGGGHNGQGAVQIAIVVGRQFGNHIGSMFLVDGAMIDLHLCSDSCAKLPALRRRLPGGRGRYLRWLGKIEGKLGENCLQAMCQLLPLRWLKWPGGLPCQMLTVQSQG